ncbi:MAG: putative toxin-antitoxin system toxin component, PIN family [Bdellovibrionota bacterium]
MRIVLDTNVFVSAMLVPASIPARIMDAWRSGSFVLVTSEVLLEELEEVLFRRKIRRRLELSDEEIRSYLALIPFNADVVAPAPVVPHVPRDRDDKMVLGTFLAGKADYLITGDEDLLELAGRYSIVTPAEFWLRHGW